MMDPSTFQIWVVNHMEKILEGQSALANALTKVAELTQREFQLMRNYHSPSASFRPTDQSCSSTANTDTSISFQRLSRCLDEWKAFHNDREQKAANNNNNNDDDVPHECCSSVSSDVGGEEDSYAETSTSRQSQTLQLDGHCYIEARSLQLGVNDEEELQMHEVEEPHGHHSQVIGHRLITRMSARDLEEEKLRRKRERDKQRSAAYRIRKRAAKAGIPPPEFARLKINRRSFRADHDAQQKSGVGENETRCVSSTGDTAQEHSTTMGSSSQAVNNEGTTEQESKPLLGIRMSFNQDQTQPKNCFTNLS